MDVTAASSASARDRSAVSKPVSRTLPRRRGWRRLAAPALLAATLPLLGACAQGFGAQTNQLYQPGPGIEERSSNVYIINAVIVTDGQDHGTMVAAFINQVRPTDRIVTFTARTSTGKALTVTGAVGTLLPDQSPVQVVNLASGGFGGIRFAGPLSAGTVATIHVTFAHAAPVTLAIPVVTRSQQFSNVDVGPAPAG